MDTELYLDTARLGRMCPAAREAERAFLTLVSQLGSSLYFEWFLQHGWNALPPRLRRRVPALQCWEGVAGLKQSFARFLNQPPECSTHFFGQSDALIHFAAGALCRQSRSILTTDLEWPAYLDHLRTMAKRRRCSIHVVPLRRMIFESGATATDVRELLLDTSLANACDGAFVSDITYLGIRLPIEELCSGLRAASARFIVIDGSQAVNHRVVNLDQINCDLYLCGTQKWLQAFHPLRVALAANRQASDLADKLLNADLSVGLFTDPLHAYCELLASGLLSPRGETVNVAALLTAAGALSSTFDSDRLQAGWLTRCSNSRAIDDMAKASTPLACSVHKSLRSGIALIGLLDGRLANEASVRKQLLHAGVVASIVDRRSVRLSLPAYHLTLRYLAHIERALQRASSNWPTYGRLRRQDGPLAGRQNHQ